jgi:hypothetical protein
MTTPTLELERLMGEYRRAQAFSIALIDGLDEEQIAWRPHPDSSAIGWHLGHQAAVNHYLVRNLTAAEPTFDADLDRLFDSATPEPGRGELPQLERILAIETRHVRRRRPPSTGSPPGTSVPPSSSPSSPRVCWWQS